MEYKKGSSMQRLCVNLLQMHDKEDEKKSPQSQIFSTVFRKR